MFQVVYGTERGSTAGSDESRVMSVKVQQIASSIYKEFEMMIQKFGESTVKVSAVLLCAGENALRRRISLEK